MYRRDLVAICPIALVKGQDLLGELFKGLDWDGAITGGRVADAQCDLTVIHIVVIAVTPHAADFGLDSAKARSECFGAIAVVHNERAKILLGECDGVAYTPSFLELLAKKLPVGHECGRVLGVISDDLVVVEEPCFRVAVEERRGERDFRFIGGEHGRRRVEADLELAQEVRKFAALLGVV